MNPDLTWHIHRGHRRLFIVGPPSAAWFPATAPGVFECPAAEQAVEHLRLTEYDNPKAGPSEIRSALEMFGWEADELTVYPKTS